ncbi:MAG TPA: hypothetical protein VGF06_05060 [Terriglobales bacterium]
MSCAALARGAAVLGILASAAHAGGPSYVAGASFFDPATKGSPLTWVEGAVSYYTDRGDLSPALPGPAADAFVADAFSRWTSLPMAAISATRVGQLDEDVSGANVFMNADGTISSPTDILPEAAKPAAVVYDRDGQVTNALLGQGAGSVALCFTNAVFGGPDKLTADAHLAHALVVMNGNCAANAAQLTDVKYRLVRVLGRVFGLDWSQANLNPSAQDYGGFPVMHASDPVSCVPIVVCYTDPDHPKMDDRAAVERLYPVTPQNLSSFPGKQLTAENTVRAGGTVWFVDENNQPVQPMQGVNVVARWVDPSTGAVSHTFVASSVSGFLFRGQAGNPVTGFNDALGRPLDQFGSDDPSLEGFFDLSGLEIPDGSDSAEYQITLEPLDPQLSEAVGPYQPNQVQPSGTPRPLTVTISRGGELQQDILMRRSAASTTDWFGPQTFANPAAVPGGGEWSGSLSGYGDADFFRLSGRSNRTLSIEVTALDEAGNPTQYKARPVIGIWSLANGDRPAPVASPGAFNTLSLGMSRLDVNLLDTRDFRIGIADARGDGRPDFRYRARVFYGDSIAPARARVSGTNAVVVRGMGFRPNTRGSVAGSGALVIAASPTQVLLNVPGRADGLQSLTLSDPATGASSVMSSALTYGAGPKDTIKLISGANPSTPAGGEAPNPIRLRVVDPDGVTPVAGASVFLTSTPAVGFSACANAASCTVLSDDDGRVETRVTPPGAGTFTITAQLAPRSYTTPQQVQTTLVGTSSSLDISLAAASEWIAQGASLEVPLSARVLGNGKPMNGRTVNFQITQGAAMLGAASAVSNASGSATDTVHISGMAAEVDVSACVAPQNSPCRIFHLFAVASSSLRLAPVSGALQLVATGQSFQPLSVRVVDVATGNPVRGAGVVFPYLIGRAAVDGTVVQLGDTNIAQRPLPVILASGQLSAQSDSEGTAVAQFSSQGIPGALVIQGTALAGDASLPFVMQSFGR